MQPVAAKDPTPRKNSEKAPSPEMAVVKSSPKKATIKPIEEEPSKTKDDDSQTMQQSVTNYAHPD